MEQVERVLFVSKSEDKYTQDEVIKAFQSLSSLDDIKVFVEKAEDRLYTTWATVDIIDKDGQKVPIQEAIEQQEILMNRGAPVRGGGHKEKDVGKTLSYKVALHPETNTLGILHLNKLYNDNQLDDEMWNDVVKEGLGGSSVGGFATDKKTTYENGSVFEELKGFNWLETTLTSSPRNPYSTGHAFSLVAKSNNKMEKENKTEVAKQEEVTSQENQETTQVPMEDRVAKLEQVISALAEKMEALMQATAGTPTEEVTEADKAEENPEDKKDTEEKVEKEDEEEKKDKEEITKSDFNSLKIELSEIKKAIEDKKVVTVAKSEMPETKSVEKVETVNHKFTEVMKGKVSLKEFTNKK